MKKSSKKKLVLLPGLDGTGLLFNELITHLTSHFQVIVVSCPPNRHCSLTELAELVREKVEDPQNTILLGESFSGIVVIKLLVENPLPLRGIIFCSAFSEAPYPNALKILGKLPLNNFPWHKTPGILVKKMGLGSSAKRNQIENIRHALSQVNPEVIAHRVQLISQFHAPCRTQVWEIPCCFLQASQDCLVSQSSANWFSERFNPFFLNKVEGPHFLIQAQPQQCAIRIVEFDAQIGETR